VTATDRERIQGLLAEGWRLLEAGDAREAALVFGRVAMVEPARAEAIRGLASARGAITEAERRSDERLDEARRALENGDLAAARAGLEAVIADGGDRDHAAVLLDRLDERGGRLERAQPSVAESAEPVLRPSPVSWSRRAFAAASTIVLVVLGAGVFSSWDRLLFGLTRPPSPRPNAVATWPPPARGGDRALAEARRLMDAGNAAAALAALDRVRPQEAAYPFARQLRQQAELALREDPPRVQRTGLRP
jgi:nitroreductase